MLRSGVYIYGMYITVDGGYSEWGEWTDCNNNCQSNDSLLIRTKTCDSPSADLGGVNCSSYTLTQEVNISKYAASLGS